MKTREILLFSFLTLATNSGFTAAQHSYEIKNVRIVTVSGPIVESGTIVIEGGKIASLGEEAPLPEQVESIDGRGLTVYPGLFDANTTIGLTEIGAVPMTNDFSELGDLMPQLLAFSAIHVESEHIPVARVNGITHVLTRPRTGTIPGHGAIVNLHGGTAAEMEIRRHGALVLRFPSLLGFSSRGFSFSSSPPKKYPEIKKEYEEKLRLLKTLLQRARHYENSRSQNSTVFDPQLEALAPVVRGDLPVLLEAESHVDIRNAVEFAEEEGLNYILTGATDAWKVADFLKQHQVRVILGPRQSLPRRQDDPIDILYRTPGILEEKGVEFAISTESSSDVRNLPYEAGSAVAYGLSREAALRSITLSPAEMLEVADELGSLEVGKRANLVVVDGDLLDFSGRIRHLFIDGQRVTLESKHTRLYERYLNR